MKIHVSPYIWLIVCLCLSSQRLYPQSTTINLNESISGNQRHEATEKITFSTGFKYTQQSGSKFLARIVQPNGGSYAFTEPVQSTTLSINTSYPVGTTAGFQDVSSTGAATYSVPINISPGVAGMDPQLSIEYNGQSGESLLGLGWAMSGLSSITRTGSNWYHEGYINNTQFNSNDRFMLDGQRLIQVSSMIYQTEIESFLRITAQGSAADPSYFKVETKDGKTLYYGNTTDSRIEAQGRSQALVWNLNKIEDKNGNYITITYYENNSSGESYPLTINYTGTTGFSPFNTIEFGYENRSVPVTSYISGSKLTMARLLNNIYVKHEGATVSRYQFLYNTTSRLTEIVEYGKNSSRLNSLIVNWGSSNTGLSESSSFTDPQTTGRIYGDFNGDGKTDMVIIKSSTWYLYHANTSNSFTLVSTGSLPSNIQSFQRGDINGDGNDDILAIRLISGNHRPYFLMSSGTGFTTVDNWVTYFSTSIEYLIGDFNGNGKDDVLVKDPSGPYAIYEFSFNGLSYSSGGTIGSSSINWGNKAYSIIKEVPLDMNGNGKTDLMVLDVSGSRFYELENNVLTLITSLSYPTINHVNLFGDFNGDGNTDIFSFDTSNNWRINTSTGSGFILTTNTTLSGFNPYVSYNNFYARDMDGNGKTDLLVVGRGTSTSNAASIYVARSDGQTFSLQNYTTSTSLAVSPDYNAVADFNGDGTVDYYYDNGSVGKMYTLHRGRNQDFISSIRNGLGVQTGFTYAPLSDNSIYTKGTDASYPVMTFQGPLYVVATAWSDNIDNTRSTTSYTYNKASLHRQGKGFLGFEKVTAINPVQNTKTVDDYAYNATYYNVYPKSNFAYTADGSPVSNITYTYSMIEYGSKRILPYFSQSVSVDQLTNTTKTTNLSIDNNGNPTSIQESFNDGSYTTTTYSNYTSSGSWLPVRPQNVTVSRKHYQDASAFSLTTTYTYQGTTGSVLTETSGPLTATYQYNTNGTISQINLSGRVTRYEYDSKGRFATKMYNPLNHLTQRTFDNATGNVLSQTAPNGGTTSYTYDDFGRQTGIAFPTGQTVSIAAQWATGTRPKNTIYTVLTNRSGSPTVKEYYDAFGRSLRTEESGFNGTTILTSRLYNTRGQIIQQSYPHYTSDQAYAREFTYDDYDRLGVDAGPTDIVMQAYSGKTTEVQKGGQRRARTVDAQGLVVSATDEGGSILYTYKSAGKPGTVNVNGVSWSITYDNFGRQSSLTDPNAGAITYQYSNFGEITSQTDANNNTYAMNYDALGRLTTRSGADGTTTYTYDPPGNPGLLQTVSYPGGSQAHTYDTYGRLTNMAKTIDGTTYTTEYGYDAQSRVTSMTYPSGFEIANIYNTHGYLAEVRRSDNDAVIWQGNGMNAFGQYTSSTSGNNRITGKTYNSFGLLEQMETHSSDIVQDLRYQFDPTTGNLMNRSDNLRGLSESFTYDKLNRLTGVTNSPVSLQATYNNLGNITSKTGAGNYSYGTQPHAVTQVTNPSGLIPTVDQNIIYTPFNKTDHITEGNLKVQFNYDHDFQRTASRLYQNDVLQKTIYYLDLYEKEVNGSNARQLHYIPGGNGLAAIYELNNSTGTMYYVHADHLGSYDVITNENGVVVQNYSFDAWGRRRNPSDWTFNNVSTGYLFNRGYTGHEHLDQFGLINMNGRMYDPLLGRMLAVDKNVQMPDFTQGFNRYSYALNNPLVYVDPNGEFFWVALPLIAKLAIAGAVIYGAGNLIAKAAAGEINSFGDGLRAFGTGALAGAALGAGIGVGLGVPILGTVIQGAGYIYLGTTALSTVSGLGQGIFNGDWSRLGNTGKLLLGNFYLDGNRSFFGEVWQGISRFSWELPQTTIGHGYSQLSNTFGAIDRVDYFGGATFSTRENRDDVWGVSIGNYINVSIDDEIDEPFRDRVLSDPLFMHEYGHTFDSQIFGISYLLAIGIPSASGAEWTEYKANRHAERYFRKHFGVDWTPYLTNYPLRKP